MPNTKITAVVLCKNAASHLRDCLASLSWCDQVILGDDGSTDDSKAIARSLHADCINLPAGLDFAAKRSFLVPYAQHEWILWLDADEIVTPALRHELETGDWRQPDVSGFFIRRMDVFFGKKLSYGETAHTWLVRLGKKDAGKWVRAVHETWKIPGKLGWLEGEILHSSHSDLEKFIEKITTYTELEANERLKVQGSRPLSTTYYLLSTVIQLLLYPPAKFIQNYLLRRGFLDGFPGLVLAWMMSFHSLCVRIQLLDRLRRQHII